MKKRRSKYVWKKVNRWSVFTCNNREIFTGTRKECEKRADVARGQFVGHVIEERCKA